MKNYLISFGISVLAVFAPIGPMISTAIVLILVDLITGLIAAKKRGEEIKSSGIGRTFSKLIVTFIGLCLSFLVEKYMINSTIPLSSLAAGVVGLKELKSVLENLDSINGSSIYKSLVEKLGSINDVKKKND